MNFAEFAVFMLLAQANREVNGILHAAENKEPIAIVIALMLALYVLFVFVRIVQRRVRRHREPNKRRFLVDPGEVLPILTAAIASFVLFAISLKLFS